MGLNTWEGVEWLDRERFANLLRWAVRLDAIEKGRDPGHGRWSNLAEPPRRPVTGWMRCGLLSRPTPGEGRHGDVGSAP